tara:strand:- start:258 stop:1040 length:783 start_codon:yes stop_codon:yes gene_type:complete
MAYSPYQIAGTKASLTDLLQESRFRGEQSKSKTAVQMGKLEEEFEADLEAAQAKARRDAKKNKGLFQGLNLLSSMFLGPLGAGLTKGITAGIQGDQQRQALKGLLSDVDADRWSKTFLKRPMKAYREEAEDLQMSRGDLLRGALGAGATGFMVSKILGGDKGSPFEQWKEGRQAAKSLSGIEEQAIKNIGAGGDSALLEKEMRKLLQNKGLPSLDVLQSSAPGLSNLWENLTKGGGLKGGMEELQSAMMLPMLLQQILGE